VATVNPAVPPAGVCLHQHRKSLLTGNTYLPPRYSRTERLSLLKISHLETLSAKCRGYSPGLPKLDPRRRSWPKGGCIRRYKQAKRREQETQHSFEIEAADGLRVVETKTCRIPYFICLLDFRQTHWSPAASSLAMYVSHTHRWGDGTSKRSVASRYLGLSFLSQWYVRNVWSGDNRCRAGA
jgi:hypothetical protein